MGINQFLFTKPFMVEQFRPSNLPTCKIIEKKNNKKLVLMFCISKYCKQTKGI